MVRVMGVLVVVVVVVHGKGKDKVVPAQALRFPGGWCSQIA